MVELLYGDQPGCCAKISGGQYPPTQCGADESYVVLHRYTHPRPHVARLYLCETCARTEPTATLMTIDDLKIAAARRARRRRVWERRARTSGAVRAQKDPAHEGPGE